MGTIRLFDENAYETEFTAAVISCKRTADNTAEIILDRTLFFPESGGQSADTGVLAGGTVTDVQIADDIITHFVTFGSPSDDGEIKDAAFPDAGDRITGMIDWPHRFSHMQQHTGEHIYSGLIHRYFGFDNVGFHLSDRNVTMDYNGTLSWEDALRMERFANEAIAANLPVTISYPSKTELTALPYRSKLDAEQMQDIRIVTIPGYDICACCATHVRTTSEIGLLKVTELMHYKDGVRLHILCGFRALADYGKKQRITQDASHLLSVPPANVPAAIEKWKWEIEKRDEDIRRLSARLLETRLASIQGDNPNPCLFTEPAEERLLRNAVNTLMQTHDGYCCLFAGSDDTGYRFIIGTKTGDARITSTALREALGARGGGSEKMVQGSVQAKQTQIEEVLAKTWGAQPTFDQTAARQ